MREISARRASRAAVPSRPAGRTPRGASRRSHGPLAHRAQDCSHGQSAVAEAPCYSRRGPQARGGGRCGCDAVPTPPVLGLPGAGRAAWSCIGPRGVTRRQGHPSPGSGAASARWVASRCLPAATAARWQGPTELLQVPLLAAGKHWQSRHRPPSPALPDGAREQRRLQRTPDDRCHGAGVSGSGPWPVATRWPPRRCDWQSSNFSPAAFAKCVTAAADRWRTRQRHGKPVV